MNDHIKLAGILILFIFLLMKDASFSDRMKRKLQRYNDPKILLLLIIVGFVTYQISNKNNLKLSKVFNILDNIRDYLFIGVVLLYIIHSKEGLKEGFKDINDVEYDDDEVNRTIPSKFLDMIEFKDFKEDKTGCQDGSKKMSCFSHAMAKYACIPNKEGYYRHMTNRQFNRVIRDAYPLAREHYNEIKGTELVGGDDIPKDFWKTVGNDNYLDRLKENINSNGYEITDTDILKKEKTKDRVCEMIPKKWYNQIASGEFDFFWNIFSFDS